MPEIDGLAALPQIREAAPAAEVVMLTASEDEENLLAAIRGGACGYLLKSEPPERIVAFLRGVASGEAALSGSVARRLLDGGARGRRGTTSIPDSISGRLSARELEVLLLLDHHLGTDEIAQRLFISEHTVRSHVKNMLAKLGVSSRREALEQPRSRSGLARPARQSFKRGLDEVGQRAQVVAALEHGGDTRGERRRAAAELAKAVGGQLACRRADRRHAHRSPPRRAAGRARTP